MPAISDQQYLRHGFFYIAKDSGILIAEKTA